MRKYLPSLILFFSSLSCLAQMDFGLGYSLGVPLKDMAKHIQPAHQMVVSTNFKLPIKKHPQFWAGAEFGFGTYAHKTIEQTFKFSDGTTTKTDVRYNSNLAYINALLRYDFPVKGKVIPYVRLTGGYTGFYTNIFIEDPNNPDGCEALDNELVFKDHSMLYGYGAGMKVYLGKGRMGNSRYMLDLSIANTAGGTIDYLNVKHLGEHQHDDPSVPNESKPFTTRFINVNTQDIHEHQLTEIYTSPINMLQVKLGFIVQFNKADKSSPAKRKCSGNYFTPFN